MQTDRHLRYLINLGTRYSSKPLDKDHNAKAFIPLQSLKYIQPPHNIYCIQYTYVQRILYLHHICTIYCTYIHIYPKTKNTCTRTRIQLHRLRRHNSDSRVKTLLGFPLKSILTLQPNPLLVQKTVFQSSFLKLRRRKGHN